MWLDILTARYLGSEIQCNAISADATSGQYMPSMARYFKESLWARSKKRVDEMPSLLA